MRVLLTGCNGYIGTHLAEALLIRHHEVLGVGRQPHPHTLFSSAPGFTYLRYDLADVRSVDSLAADVEGVEAVFHVAAQQDVTANLELLFRGNVETTANLLQVMRVAGIKRLIHSSTQTIYGRPQNLPVTENDIPTPESGYEVTKYMAELLTRVSATSGEMQAVSLRYASVYGGRNNLGAVYDFCRAATENRPIELWAMGELKKDYVYIEDVVKANLAALEKLRGSSWEAINVGSGGGVTMQELCETIVEVLNSLSQVVLSERASHRHFDCYLSTEKAERMLAYRPTPLKQALEVYAQQFLS